VGYLVGGEGGEVDDVEVLGEGGELLAAHKAPKLHRRMHLHLRTTHNTRQCHTTRHTPHTHTLHTRHTHPLANDDLHVPLVWELERQQEVLVAALAGLDQRQRLAARPHVERRRRRLDERHQPRVLVTRRLRSLSRQLRLPHACVVS
jgi:hypothetical protein